MNHLLVKHCYLYISLYLLLVLSFSLLINSCSTIKYVPVNTTTTVTVKDTVILKDTLVLFNPPEETNNNIVLLQDTSVVETSLAVSVAYVDPITFDLKHTITNKPTPLPVQVQYPEHQKEKNSVTVKEVPVKVEVEKEITPPWAYRLIIYSTVLTLLVLFHLYLKIKKRD